MSNHQNRTTMKKQIFWFLVAFFMSSLLLVAFMSNHGSMLILAPLCVLIYFKCRNTHSAPVCTIIAAVLGFSVFITTAIQEQYISNERLYSLFEIYDINAAFMSIVYYFMSIDIECKNSEPQKIEALN